MKPTATPDTITLHVPFRIIKRGGRKEVQLPPGAPVQLRTDNTLIKALARAFRWKRMLESGEFNTIAELAEDEGIAPSYMTRVMRFTLLAPDIVEEILEWRQGPEMTLARLLKGFPVEWEGQKKDFRKNSISITGPKIDGHPVLDYRPVEYFTSQDRTLASPLPA